MTELGKLFVFVEDDQGYSTNYILVESSEPLTFSKIAKLQNVFGGARQFSVHIDSLLHVYPELKVIDRTNRAYKDADRHGPMPEQWSMYPVVIGATGNY
jgi:hypothetical protein